VRGVLADDLESPLTGDEVDIPVTEERYIPQTFAPLAFASAEIQYAGAFNITILHADIICAV